MTSSRDSWNATDWRYQARTSKRATATRSVRADGRAKAEADVGTKAAPDRSHKHSPFRYRGVTFSEVIMACEPTILRDVPLFALLDDDEMKVLAAQVELKTFAA